MRKINKILESLRQYESTDKDPNELFYNAQDIALDGCKCIIDKLQEHVKDGYVEDFYNLLVKIVALIENGDLDPRKLLDEIQNDSQAINDEEQEEDKQWLISSIDANTHSLEQFNKLVQEKINE